MRGFIKYIKICLSVCRCRTHVTITGIGDGVKTLKMSIIVLLINSSDTSQVEANLDDVKTVGLSRLQHYNFVSFVVITTKRSTSI